MTHAPMPIAMAADWEVQHGFTHFATDYRAVRGRVERIEGDGFLHPMDAVDEVALPSVMRKCVAAAGV